MGHRFVSFQLQEPMIKLHCFIFSIINPAKVINELGWRPRHVGFVEEIGIYYKAWAAHKAAQKAESSS